ncbi:MAG TPA: hypothetical protein DCL08_07585 [Anaerolineaceae bacterium]|jgi:hypothetical protein|nr:MAG: hypothetical protein XE06_1191 [Anaerolineaceae bacterium 46_22]HAF49082.1 hypothetical protein [Anaerolineaceae bacterium]
MVALSTLAFLLIVITAMVILIFRDWRINTAALALQYLGVFYLVTLSWPIGLAIVKLIVGWMATAAIGLTCLRQMDDNPPTESTSSLFFRALAGLMIILVMFVISSTLQETVFPNVDLVIIRSGLMIVGMALMQLGTNASPYLTIMSLLSFMAGFEVIHAALERSTLLIGLMASVNLGLALVGVYFIMKTNERNVIQKEEEDK